MRCCCCCQRKLETQPPVPPQPPFCRERGWEKGLLQIRHREENRPGGNFHIFSLAEIAGVWLKAHPTAVPSTAWGRGSAFSAPLWAEHLHSSALQCKGGFFGLFALADLFSSNFVVSL